MTVTVNVYEAKTRLSQLLNDVESGEDVVIARNGRPVARLVPVVRARPDRVPGVWRGRVTVAADFDQLDPQTDLDWYGS